MSLSATTALQSGFGFPRVSGDEPFPELNALVANVFSPRERG